jgi:hypothetical protein
MSFIGKPVPTFPGHAPGIKKGRKGPFLRTAAAQMALATSGGALPYQYLSRNKISHFHSHLPFPCAPL